jgi:quercetin dioxygenase-like cupin family protein
MKQSDINLDDATLERETFAALATSIAPQALTDEVRVRLRERVLRTTQMPAAAPQGTETFSVAAEGWVKSAPNVEMKWLRKDIVAGTQEVLIRLGPGVRVPEHSHKKEEHMVILEGECLLGEHLLRQGDVHIAPPGSWHPAITTARGVLMLLRCEDPFPAG